MHAKHRKPEKRETLGKQAGIQEDIDRRGEGGEHQGEANQEKTSWYPRDW